MAGYRRCRPFLFGAALLALACPATPAWAQAGGWPVAQEDTLELRIAELRLRERQVLARDVLLFEDAEGRIYVPFTDLVDLLGFPIEEQADGSIAGWFLREHQRIAIDPAARTVTVAGSKVPLGEADLLVIEGQLHVVASALDTWLALRPHWDGERQQLTFAPPYLLPHEESARRAGGHVAGGRQDIDTTGFRQVTPEWRLLGWPVLTANASVTREPRGEGISAQGSALIEGDLLFASARLALSGDTRGTTGARLTLGRHDPQARLLGPLGASVIEAGDIAAPFTPLLQRNVFGAGIRIGREPLDTSGSFDTVDLNGDAPPGWQAELYRDSELLGFQTVGADGRYDFREVPTQFGLNRFRILLYGPSGERQEIERVVDIAASLTRPGEWRYSLLALRQGLSLFKGQLGGTRAVDDSYVEGLPVDAGYGTPATYLEARGAHGLTRSVGITALAAWRQPDHAGATGEAASGHVGAGMTAGLGGMVLGADGVMQDNGALAGRATATTALAGISLAGTYERYGRDFRSDDSLLGTIALRSRLGLSADGRLGALGIGISASQIRRFDGEGEKSAALRTNVALGAFSLTHRLSWRDTGGRQRAEGAFALSGAVGVFRLRGGIDYDIGPDTRLRRLRGQVSYRLADWYLQAGADRDLANGGGQFSIAANRDWNGARLGADLRYDQREGDLRGFLTFSLALDRDPVSGRLRLGRDARGQRGTLIVEGFRDADGNGVRDQGEDAVEGFAVSVDPRGRMRAAEATLVEELPIARVIAVLPEVDGIDDPYLVPRDAGYLVTTRPASVTRLSIPLVDSGEVEVLATGPDGAGEDGVVLTITRCEGAGETMRERTAFDGRAFFARLLPGCHRIARARGGEGVEVTVEQGEVARVSLP